MVVPSASLCDVLECDATWADSEPDLPLPMCPPSIWPSQMEWRRRFSRSKFMPSASRVVGGIVRGVAGGCGSSLVPSPDVRSCMTTLMAAPKSVPQCEVMQAVPHLPLSQECHRQYQAYNQRSAINGTSRATNDPVPSPFLLWPTAVNAAGTEAMSLDSKGERLSDAHHDWEERDGASDSWGGAC